MDLLLISQLSYPLITVCSHCPRPSQKLLCQALSIPPVRFLARCMVSGRKLVDNKTGFLNLDTIDVLGWMSPPLGDCPCRMVSNVHGLDSLDANSTHFGCDSIKYLQTLTDIPQGAKLLSVVNSCSKSIITEYSADISGHLR